MMRYTLHDRDGNRLGSVEFTADPAEVMSAWHRMHVQLRPVTTPVVAETLTAHKKSKKSRKVKRDAEGNDRAPC